MALAVTAVQVIVCLLSSLSTTVMSTKDYLTASEGDKVRLACNRTVSSEPVDWKYLGDPAVGELYVCIGGQLVINYRQRFELSTSDYSLTINNASVDDSGLYICTEESGIGQKHFRQLTVIEKRTTTHSFIGYSESSKDQPLNYSTSFMAPLYIVVACFAVVSIIAMIVAVVSARRLQIHQNHLMTQYRNSTIESKSWNRKSPANLKKTPPHPLVLLKCQDSEVV